MVARVVPPLHLCLHNKEGSKMGCSLRILSKLLAVVATVASVMLGHGSASCSPRDEPCCLVYHTVVVHIKMGS